MGISAKFLAASVTLFAATAVGAAGFVVPDTIDLRSYAPWTYPPPKTFIANGPGDSLIIDSISFSPVSIPGGVAQIRFRMLSGSEPKYAVEKDYWIFYYTYNGNAQVGISTYPNGLRVAIPPNATVTLNEPGFDHCINCPTAKHAAAAAIGDTLKARVRFYSGSQRDSVLFLSIERTSSGIIPFSLTSSYFKGYDFFDVAGRRIQPSRSPRAALPVPRR
jgi:hypothetical protein